MNDNNANSNNSPQLKWSIPKIIVAVIIIAIVIVAIVYGALELNHHVAKSSPVTKSISTKPKSKVSQPISKPAAANNNVSTNTSANTKSVNAQSSSKSVSSTSDLANTGPGSAAVVAFLSVAVVATIGHLLWSRHKTY